MKSITVFCGSSEGSDAQYAQAAYSLGIQLAQQNYTVIYGGAKIGLMGTLANAALGANGNVVGVIPTFLKKKEVVHNALTQLIEVDSMHERKHKMSELADGFITLPGGFGTLEELFEMLTWAQLNRHQKPIGILNINGYYDELLSFIYKMIDQQFLRHVNLELLLVSDSIEDLLARMNKYKAPELPRWS
jgi:uncharacterized protein (TIGR00730 family)